MAQPLDADGCARRGLGAEGIAILESAGFDGEQAGMAWAALAAYTIGTVS